MKNEINSMAVIFFCFFHATIIYCISHVPLCTLNFKQAKERIRELERELEMLQQKLTEEEDKSNKMYLHMYAKDQDQAETSLKAASQAVSRVSVPELMHQLQVTQDELENLRVS